MPNETAQLLGAIHQAHQEGKQTALATVVRVIGSAYRREGAKMLVREDGGSACMISGGCLEQEMIEVAMQILAKGQPERTIFDYNQEKTWWPGCGGTVEVWVEPIDSDGLLMQWLSQSPQAESSALATVIGGGGGRVWVKADGSFSGSIEPLEVQESVIRTARQMLVSGSRPTTRYVQEAEVFFDLSSPMPELVLFGAGHDAKPMANQALVLGFKVTVVDARADLLAQFEDVQALQANPEEFAGKLELSPRTGVIVMNHHLDIDRKTLRYLFDTPVQYLGLLGPRNRLEKILDVLRLEGFEPSTSQLARIRNPIGVDLGAESPEEIALAVLAEILALQRGFKGGFLSDKKSGIHDAISLNLEPAR